MEPYWFANVSEMFGGGVTPPGFGCFSTKTTQSCSPNTERVSSFFPEGIGALFVMLQPFEVHKASEISDITRQTLTAPLYSGHGCRAWSPKHKNEPNFTNNAPIPSGKKLGTLPVPGLHSCVFSVQQLLDTNKNGGVYENSLVYFFTSFFEG